MPRPDIAQKTDAAEHVFSCFTASAYLLTGHPVRTEVLFTEFSDAAGFRILTQKLRYRSHHKRFLLNCNDVKLFNSMKDENHGSR